MKLWPWARKANEDGSIRQSLDLFRLLTGGRGTQSGVSVTHKTALEQTVVLACARVISEGIAQVPFKLYRQVGENIVPAVDHPLYRLLHRKPNGWMTSFEMRETLAMHACLTGDGLAFVNRGLGGVIHELIPIERSCWTVKQAQDYSLFYTITAPNGRTQDFPQEAVWHWRGPSWNGVCGLDIVRLAAESIGLSAAAQDSQARIQRQGGNIPGVYTVEGTLNPQQYKDLRKFLDENFDGVQNVARTRLLDRSAKFYPTAQTGVEAQLIETRKFEVEDLCRGFRVMPIMVGYSDKAATYASAEQMFLAHVVHCLTPWYERIEQSGEAQLLTDMEAQDGYFLKFNAAGLMRGSHKDRAEYFARALGAGGGPAWMTQDEVRALEEMNPMGGDAAKLPQITNAAPQSAPKKDDDGQPAV